MEKRRVVFNFGVHYNTPPKKLKLIPDTIKKIILAAKQTSFDRAHFKEFGDSALLFEVVYYVMSADYNLYMDIQQQINLAIKETFEKEKIAFAHPTRIVHLTGNK